MKFAPEWFLVRMLFGTVWYLVTKMDSSEAEPFDTCFQLSPKHRRAQEPGKKIAA